MLPWEAAFLHMGPFRGASPLARRTLTYHHGLPQADRAVPVPSSLLCSPAQPWLWPVFCTIQIKRLCFLVTRQTHAKETDSFLESCGSSSFGCCFMWMHGSMWMWVSQQKGTQTQNLTVMRNLLCFLASRHQNFDSALLYVLGSWRAVSPFRGNTVSKQALWSLLSKDFSATGEGTLLDQDNTQCVWVPFYSLNSGRKNTQLASSTWREKSAHLLRLVCRNVPCQLSTSLPSVEEILVTKWNACIYF